tara:strand:- start:42 stop:236 length:195 start_codon:yes stop_codon:yes gene_type:complete
MDKTDLKKFNELNRLHDVYDKTYEKYDNRMTKLNEKRDYELDYIWNAICQEHEKLGLDQERSKT